MEFPLAIQALITCKIKYMERTGTRVGWPFWEVSCLVYFLASMQSRLEVKVAK